MRTGIILFSFLIMQSFLFPATIYVPNDYPTIQGAVDAAIDGDTIIVDPGSYVENVDILEKTLYLKSAQGPALTVIDAGQSGSGVKFSDHVYDASLEGFTITNGTGTLVGPHYCGGGIYLSGNNSHVTIKDNVITLNYSHYGGGVYSSHWAGTIIRNNTISWNVSSGTGGGICMGYSSADHKGQIIDNLICDNTSLSGGGINLTRFEYDLIGNTIIDNTALNCGGGVFHREFAHAEYLDNIISGNTAGIDGGGLYNQASRPRLVNTIVCNNSASQNGGGLWSDNSLDIRLVNSVVYGNTANLGGGLYYGGKWNSNEKKLSNSILWGNQAIHGAQLYLWSNSTTGTNLSVQYCNIEGGWAEVFMEPGCTLDWLSGNIDQAPLFQNPAILDFHLGVGSPCIDTGTGDIPNPPESDFEGEPRIMGLGMDMGADEYWIDHFSVLVPDDYSSISDAVANVASGYTVLVAPGTYHEDVWIHAKEITLKSTHGPAYTVIEGTGQTSTLYITGYANEITAVEGFTITGGVGMKYYLGGSYYPIYARCGGGIFVESCRTVIQDCIITENHVNGSDVNLAYGGGVFFKDIGYDPSLMLNCLVVDNLITAGYGGGIFVDNDSIVEIINCTITGNQSTYSYGGLDLRNTDSWVTNSILYGNTAAQPYYENLFATGNPQVTYSNVGGGWPGIGNIDADPLFADSREGDYHLTYLSSCKDMGDSGAPHLPELDFEGDPRVAYGKVDMGCDEFHPHLYYTGNATPSGTIKIRFMGLPGTVINGLIIGANIFDPPLPCDYGLWYMDDPIYFLWGLGILPGDGIIVYPGTIPSTPAGPYTVYLQAAIDNWLTNLCRLDVQ